MSAMRWKCKPQGCFNRLMRPKIEVFDDCFPGRMAFGDVDAVLEIEGNFAFLEWKCHEPRDLDMGQHLTYERLTALSNRISVMVVWGNAETMAVRAAMLVWQGRFYPIEPMDLRMLKGKVCRWFAHVCTPKQMATLLRNPKAITMDIAL